MNCWKMAEFLIIFDTELKLVQFIDHFREHFIQTHTQRRTQNDTIWLLLIAKERKITTFTNFIHIESNCEAHLSTLYVHMSTAHRKPNGLNVLCFHFFFCRFVCTCPGHRTELIDFSRCVLIKALKRQLKHFGMNTINKWSLVSIALQKQLLGFYQVNCTQTASLSIKRCTRNNDILRVTHHNEFINSKCAQHLIIWIEYRMHYLLIRIHLQNAEFFKFQNMRAKSIQVRFLAPHQLIMTSSTTQ